MKTPERIGAFRVGEELGRGAMGRVLAAVHEETGVEAAVKVLLGSTGEEQRVLFRREVQAQARLVHPRITWLMDAGVVDGVPYVVMERAQGSVADRLPLGDWEAIREILVQALDGLAYSHARDVVHLDIKPQNLLLFPEGVKLADFGLAQLTVELEGEHSSLEEREMLAGTPYYMAPEQIERRWRRYGPWTDLYALGCVAYELVCGVVPFGESSSPVGALLRHLGKERPTLRPRVAVPKGLDGWIERAMALDWRARFQNAAEAAEALLELGGPMAASQLLEEEWEGRIAEAETEVLTLRLPEIPRAPDQGQREARAHSVEVETSVRWAPETWRTLWRAELPAPLQGTGRGLFGLREIPFVGRDAERDILWENLREVLSSGRSQVVVVEGEAGTGKSRLVEWIATRARELGLMGVLRMRHSPGGGRRDEGGAGMLREELRLAGLEREEIAELLRERGSDEIDARALAEIALPSTEVDEGGYRFSFAGESRVVLRHWVEREARRAPRLLWIDDAQWSSESCRLACEVAGKEAPLLVVLVMQPEALSPELVELLEPLPRLSLRPLDPEQHRQLIKRMLPLPEDVARALAARTEGNPLFAMQILADWLDSGTLQSSREGFALEESHEGLPDSLHEIWQRRLRRELDRVDGVSEDLALEALGTAALMGREITAEEWEAVTGLVGGARELVELLAEGGLLRWSAAGWRFAHGLFGESMERLGKELGLLERWHERAARALEIAWADHPEEVAARRGRHLRVAGAIEEACEAFLQAQARALRLGQLSERIGLLEEWMELLGEMDEGEARGAWYRKARLYWLGTKLQQSKISAEAACRECEVLAEQTLERGEWASYGLAARVHVGFLIGSGDYKRVVELGEQALSRIPRGEPIRNNLLLSVGWSAHRLGQRERALELLEDAIELGGAGEGGVLTLEARAARAMVLHELGERDVARREYEEVLPLARARSRRELVIRCVGAMGDLARERGDHQAAREYYEESLAHAERWGMADRGMFARFNLLQILAAEKHFVALKRGMKEWEEDFGDTEEVGQFLLHKRYLELLIEIAEGPLDEVVRRVEELEELRERGGYFDPDFRILAGLGAELLRERPEPIAAVVEARVAALGREAGERLE